MPRIAVILAAISLTTTVLPCQTAARNDTSLNKSNERVDLTPAHREPATTAKNEILAQEAVTVLSLLLAAAAIVFAIRQYKDARRTMEGLQNVATQLVLVEQGLSTRYLAVFPDFMIQLIDMLNKATKSIEILCDVPAYGILSAQQAWTDYSHILIRKADQVGMEVSITVLDASERASLLRVKFADATRDWAGWKNNSTNRANLEKFAKRFPKRPSIRDLTFEQLTDWIDAADASAISHDFSRISIAEIRGRLPFYYWLVDGKQAIFAIAAYGSPSREYGFVTTDPKLIAAFSEMRKQYDTSPVVSVSPMLPEPGTTPAD